MPHLPVRDKRLNFDLVLVVNISRSSAVGPNRSIQIASFNASLFSSIRTKRASSKAMLQSSVLTPQLGFEQRNEQIKDSSLFYGKFDTYRLFADKQERL